jgi:pyridoxal phosphate enzyme (YggS family)
MTIHGILLPVMPDSQSGRSSKATVIDRNVHEIQRRIAVAAEKAGRSPSSITLIAVTKTVGADKIRQASAAGIRHFGESRVQESRAKIELLSSLQPQPIWHMVGHLQTNKAKLAADLFDFIHSVDSLKVAQAISTHASRYISVLIQVNLAGEETKSGFAPAEVGSAVAGISHLPKIEVKGLMTIAPYTRDPEEVRPIFRELRGLRDSLGLEQLSMGMTDDFEVAVEEGATMVRIGRAIFGDREV